MQCNQDYEFIDTYAIANDCTDCCSDEDGYDGCTYSVLDNPYAFNPLTGQIEDPKRIDYIFIKGMNILSSNVVFNSDPWISDHSGVLTRISLH